MYDIGIIKKGMGNSETRKFNRVLFCENKTHQLTIYPILNEKKKLTNKSVIIKLMKNCKSKDFKND